MNAQKFLITVNVINYLNKYGDAIYGVLNFDKGMTLSTSYTGYRVSFWYDGTNWYGFGMNSSQLIYNAPTSAAHILEVNNSTIASINSSGLYVGSNLLSSTILGYLANITSDVQTQLNGKQISGSYFKPVREYEW